MDGNDCVTKAWLQIRCLLFGCGAVAGCLPGSVAHPEVCVRIVGCEDGVLISDARVTFRYEGHVSYELNEAYHGQYCDGLGYADVTVEKEGFETKTVGVQGSRDDVPPTEICLKRKADGDGTARILENSGAATR